MSTWRPSPNCIYTIGDMHGYNVCLDLILKRILPLRKGDEIVFLGDYIDRGPDSDKIIDTLMGLIAKYGEQVTCLMGNHEYLMGTAFNELDANIHPDAPHPAQIWLSNGGIQCLQSYAKRAGLSEDKIQGMTLQRFRSLIPDSHFEFIRNLFLFYETDNYKFMHAGCDPFEDLGSQSRDILLWDRSLYEYVTKAIFRNKKLEWDKTIVCGHNWKGPIINDKYIMIDSSVDKRVLCLELNSMEGYFADPNNSRLVKADIKPTTNPFAAQFKGSFKRHE